MMGKIILLITSLIVCLILKFFMEEFIEKMSIMSNEFSNMAWMMCKIFIFGNFFGIGVAWILLVTFEKVKKMNEERILPQSIFDVENPHPAPAQKQCPQCAKYMHPRSLARHHRSKHEKKSEQKFQQ